MSDKGETSTIWVFTGPRAHFPSGIFTTVALAEAWIRHHGLTGTLTRYPVDEGVYDWASRMDLVSSTNPNHSSPEFIAGFSTASQEYYHYENGTRD